MSPALLKLFLIFFATLAAGVSVAAATPPGSKRVGPGIGVGFELCSEYNYHAQSGGTDREADKAWIYGFVTGYNVFARKPKPMSLFMSYDADPIVRQIDKQCASNPNAVVVDEVNKFIRLLMGHQKQRSRL